MKTVMLCLVGLFGYEDRKGRLIMAVNALSVEHAVYDALSVVKRLSLKTASVVVISHSKLNLYQYASVCTRVINTHSILGKRRMHLYD